MAANSSSTSPLPWARINLGLAASGLLLAPLSVQAEIARVGQWALNADATVTTFTDSNPSLSSDKEATLGVTLEPNLRLQRVGTQLRTEAYLRVAPTYFTDDSVEDQTDVAAGFLFAYPYSDDRLPRSTLEGSYRDVTQASSAIGRRISGQTYQARGTHRFISTGKLGAILGFVANQTKFNEEGLNQNQEGRLTIGARYEKTPLTEYSLGVTQIWGRSSPNNPNSSDRNMVETDLALGAQGRILPFIDAEVYAGLGAVSYRNDIAEDNILPIAGGEITWLATARTSITGSIDAKSDFSPDGNAQKTYRVGLDASVGLREGFRVIVGGSISRVEFESVNETRSDDQYSARAQLAYAPSQRVSVSVNTEYTDQYSTRSTSDFNRWYNSVSASYRF